MKYEVTYNRMESRKFTLTASELLQAIRAHVEGRWSTLTPPANARQTIEISLEEDADGCNDGATLIQQFIYDSESVADTSEVQS
jgi:hypothetical protein